MLVVKWKGRVLIQHLVILITMNPYCPLVVIHSHVYIGTVILLENLRFHIEEEGKGVDIDGKKVLLVIKWHIIVFLYLMIV